MLGWHVSVYRKVVEPAQPATFDSPTGALLAQWQGRSGALSWLNDLAGTDDAIDLAGNGYPNRYTVRCRAVRPVVLAGPPDAREHWGFEAGDKIDWSVWKGQTFVEHDELVSVPADEWLIVEAWDES